jgi:RimJ/RimL family protein N-acetyltransferase
VLLRDWRRQDLEAYAEWLRPHHRWHDFNGPYLPRTQEEAIPGIIEKHGARIAAGGWPEVRERLVIVDRRTGELLGTVSRYWECEQTNWISLGVIIFDDSNWGKGLGYEALRLWCGYLFESLPTIVRLGFSTWSGNEGMVRLAQKLGFVEEARHRMARIVEGEYFDSLGYGMLRSEWESRS